MMRSLACKRLIWIALTAIFSTGAFVQVSCQIATAQGTPVVPVAAANSYLIDATFDPDLSTITGSETLSWTNRTGSSIESLVFRLFPNAEYYEEGNLTISFASVDGIPVTPSLDPSETVLTLPLQKPVADSAQVEVSLEFSTVIPTDSAGTFGVFSHDTATGAWVLADWYPILSVWVAGAGWYEQLPTSLGDPTFSEAATYELRLETPADYQLFASGQETATQRPDGGDAWFVVTDLVREFTLVLDRYASSDEISTGETMISFNLTGTAGSAQRVAARRMLDWAAESLIAFGDRYGAYPDDELDLIEVDLGSGVLGVSWSGVIFLDADLITSMLSTSSSSDEHVRVTIAHEIGHQWWGNQVHANTNTDQFLIEGMTHYLAMVAIGEVTDAATEARLVRSYLAAPYLRGLESYGDAIADQPGELLPVPGLRGPIFYGKSGLGFLAIREEIGDVAFFEALRNFADEYHFAVATPADLLTAFVQTGGSTVQAIWNHWFEEANGSAAEVEELLSAAESTS